jgi:hypothetical protein
MDNAIVLSEDLEESTVQALVEIAFGDLFPELCDIWHATITDICSRYKEELVKRKDTVRQEIARGVDSLYNVLREVAVKDVIRLFP